MCFVFYLLNTDVVSLVAQLLFITVYGFQNESIFSWVYVEALKVKFNQLFLKYCTLYYTGMRATNSITQEFCCLYRYVPYQLLKIFFMLFFNQLFHHPGYFWLYELQSFFIINFIDIFNCKRLQYPLTIDMLCMDCTKLICKKSLCYQMIKKFAIPIVIFATTFLLIKQSKIIIDWVTLNLNRQ